jgi:hypothetical protein
MADYGDAEDFLVAWLKLRFATNNVIDELPYNLTFVMPLIVVERFGGGTKVLGLDQANVDVDVFQPDRAAAKAYAGNVRRAIEMELPGYRSGMSHISRAENISAPTIAPWDSNRQIRRATSAYRLTLHTAL